MLWSVYRIQNISQRETPCTHGRAERDEKTDKRTGRIIPNEGGLRALVVLQCRIGRRHCDTTYCAYTSIPRRAKGGGFRICVSFVFDTVDDAQVAQNGRDDDELTG